MANARRNRIAPQVLDDDIDAFLALQAMPGYRPANPAFSLEALTLGYELVRQTEKNELHTQNAADAARDAAVKGARDFHELVLGMKNQVKAQFGMDSDEVASLGLKKRSERKQPVRGKKTGTEG